MRVLFVNPNSAASSYQALAGKFSAIEPPTWSLLLAESCRRHTRAEVSILDCDAERLSPQDSVIRIAGSRADLVVFVVYGQNPNSGTVNMHGALSVATLLKQVSGDRQKTVFVGSHVSALPLEVLSLPEVDIVLTNEGVYALRDLVSSNLHSDLSTISGIGYKEISAGGEVVFKLNKPSRLVPQALLDEDLPGYAWDLLPQNARPLDMYRAHFWHAGFNHEKRTPFAAIYTSLGCNFGCDFCMINILNRTDNSQDLSAADFKGMRYWSNEWIQRQLLRLSDMGVETLRISDEMFFLNKRFYTPVLEKIVDAGLHFNMWAYARVDSVREESLRLFKDAGVNWLALGIEAGNQDVRQEVSKGSYRVTNVQGVCKSIRESGLNIISNYIFGLPNDTMETMRQTLDLALELNTEMANMYPCQALPGSPIHNKAKSQGWKLPESFSGYGFLSYDALPLRTKYLTSAEVLKFRDDAWMEYFTNDAYLDLVEKKFGISERQNVIEMTKIPLKRKLLGH